MNRAESHEMSRKRVLVVMSTLIVVGLVPATAIGEDATGASDSTRRPNIVLILADDLGFSDVGCYGGEINTPHIDSLASDGMRFRQFYNCARCVPTRKSLLTGLYPQQVDGKHSVTLAEVLRGTGYRTLMTGKWHGHPGLPTEHGFDRYYGLTSGSCNFFNPGNRRPGEPEPAKDHGYVRPWVIDGKRLRPYTPEDPNWYATDAFTDYALAYLDEYADEDRPFFLFLSYTAPHHPLQAPEHEIAKYRGKYTMGRVRVRRSEDGGKSWGPDIHLGNGLNAGGLRVDEDTGHVLAFVEEKHPPAPLTVFRSTDHGKTWQVQETVIRPDKNGNVPFPRWPQADRRHRVKVGSTSSSRVARKGARPSRGSTSTGYSKARTPATAASP